MELRRGVNIYMDGGWINWVGFGCTGAAYVIKKVFLDGNWQQVGKTFSLHH